MTTVAQIIEDLGGPAEIAKATKLTDGAIRLWKHRNTIPRSAWPDLIEAFPRKITMSALKATEAA